MVIPNEPDNEKMMMVMIPPQDSVAVIFVDIDLDHLVLSFSLVPVTRLWWYRVSENMFGIDAPTTNLHPRLTCICSRISGEQGAASVISQLKFLDIASPSLCLSLAVYFFFCVPSDEPFNLLFAYVSSLVPDIPLFLVAVA